MPLMVKSTKDLNETDSDEPLTIQKTPSSSKVGDQFIDKIKEKAEDQVEMEKDMV